MGGGGGGYANQKGTQQLQMTTQQVQMRQCTTQEGTARTGGESSLSKRNKTSSLSNTVASQMVGSYNKNINGSSSNSNSVKKQTTSKQLDQQAQFLIQSPQGNNNRLKQGQFESPVVSKSNLSPYLEKTKSRLCSPPSAKTGEKQRTGVAVTAEQMQGGISSFRNTAMMMRKRLGEK